MCLARKPWFAFWLFTIKDSLGSADDAIADEAPALKNLAVSSAQI